MKLILTVVTSALLLSLPSGAQSHPRLLFGSGEIAGLRTKITQAPWSDMYAVLTADAESGQYRDFAGKRSPSNPTGPVDSWGESVNAYRCAFLYVLTGSDTWAQKARAYTEYRVFDTGTADGWAMTNVKGLHLYFHGKAVALAYDWCYDAPSWQTATSGSVSTPFRETISQKLLAQADVIATNGGTEQNTDAASNWQGIRGSSAVICYLATDQAYNSTRFTDMYNKTETYIRQNIGTSATARGWNIEGIGYLGYPWAHVAPAAVAARRANPANDLLASTPGSAYTLWSQYAATVRFNRPEHTANPVWMLHPDFGDDNATADDANGCFGLAFPFSKPELVPGLKYWYERTLVPEQNYDFTRGGTIFSILSFPDTIAGSDPLAIPAWRDGFNDSGGNGFFTWRNQYNNSDDMVAQMYLKLRGNKGHNGPDALSFRILGLNTAWAVGGGRYGTQLNGMDAYLRSMNTLYTVNPDTGSFATNGNAGSVVGTPLIRADGSGHVVSSISKNNVGTASHKRWFASDHSRAAGVEAVYVIADTSTDGFFWQFNTLDEPGVSIATTSNSFEIAGRDGATLRGTVLFPTGSAVFEQGTRIRGSKFAYQRSSDPSTGYGTHNRWLTLRGDGDYVIVITVAKAGQSHPAVSKTAGRVVNSQVTVGTKTYAILPADIGYDTAAPTLPAAPAAPTGLSATAHPNYQQIDLAWTDAASNENGFVIERSTDGTLWTAISKLVVANATSVSDNTVAAGTTYQYRVRAYNDGGDSPNTNTATATTITAGTSPWIADESFEGCNLGALNGQGSGGGWKQPWTAQTNNGTTNVIDVSANPLSAAGVSGGNKAVRMPWGESVGSRSFVQAQSIVAEKPIYISYLMRADSGTPADGDAGWVFNNSYNYDWRYAGVRRSATGPDFTVSSRYGNTASGGPEFMPGTSYLLVCRVTPSEMKLWVNPAAESDSPAVTYNGGWTNTNFPGLGLSSKPNGSATFVVDRLIAAWDFQTALYAGNPPIPAPPVFQTQPSGGPFTSGRSTTLSPTVSGYPAPTFQWWRKPVGGAWEMISGANQREYTFTPVMADNGVQLRCDAVNESGNATSDPLTLQVVEAINQPPTISNLPDQSIAAGTSIPAIAFTIGDDTTTAANLALSATSSNTTLLPQSGIVFGGSGAARTLTLTPAPGLTGSSTVSVTVTDAEGLFASDTLLLTVSGGAPVASASASAPATDAYDQYQFATGGSLDSGRDYSDNGGPPGQTFTTPSGGDFILRSVSFKGGGSADGSIQFSNWAVRISAVNGSALGAALKTVTGLSQVTGLNSTSWLTISFPGDAALILAPNTTYAFEFVSETRWWGVARSADNSAYAGGTAFNTTSNQRQFNSTTWKSAVNYDHTFHVDLEPAAVPTPFSQWQQNAFAPGTPEAKRLPSADADDDGLNNLTEYGLGTNPSAANPMPAHSITSISGADYLQLQWSRPAGRNDLTTTGQVSPVLVDGWTADPEEVSTIIVAASGGMETVTIRMLDPIGAGSHSFLRARFVLAE